MNRTLLDYKGKTYAVESCATCPARTTGENGLPRCEIRDARLHAHIVGAFPQVAGNRALGYAPCPVYREGTKRLAPMSERIDKVSLHEKPKIAGILYCCWCGIKINPSKAVIIINDREPNRIYDRFECLDQYLRSK